MRTCYIGTLMKVVIPREDEAVKEIQMRTPDPRPNEQQ